MVHGQISVLEWRDQQLCTPVDTPIGVRCCADKTAAVQSAVPDLVSASALDDGKSEADDPGIGPTEAPASTTSGIRFIKAPIRYFYPDRTPTPATTHRVIACYLEFECGLSWLVDSWAGALPT